MPYPLCRHIKSDGVQCGSPALNRKTFCYFHQTLHSRHQRYRSRPADHKQTLNLDAIETRLDLQMNLSQVVNALATGQLDPQRGMLLLKLLEAAEKNMTALERFPTFDPNPERPDAAQRPPAASPPPTPA